MRSKRNSSSSTASSVALLFGRRQQRVVGQDLQASARSHGEDQRRSAAKLIRFTAEADT